MHRQDEAAPLCLAYPPRLEAAFLCWQIQQPKYRERAKGKTNVVTSSKCTKT